MQSLEEKIKDLPPEYKQEVQDFIEFIFEKRIKRHRKKPLFDWAGTMKDLRNQYTSVELQHKISQLRSGMK